MAMVFFTSTSTPLWTTAFTPKNARQYAGTCIFLIMFATIFRLLLALRVNICAILAAAEQRSHKSMIQQYASEAKPRVRPWKAGEAVMTAALDVVVAGVSYLL